MTEDEIIAQVCGVPVPKYACGHTRGFSMGLGYSDPLAKCRDCRARADRIKAVVSLVAVALLLVGAVLLHHLSP